MLWRRICVDVNETDDVIGASIEYYDDSSLRANSVVVLASERWSGKTPGDVLGYELVLKRPDGQLAFHFDPTVDF